MKFDLKYKKGVSPLIATVLLIAFAVSLGAVVMNWTSGATQEDYGSTSTENNLCKSVKILVLEKEGQKAICLDRDNGRIVVDIENGPVMIDGLRMSYLGKTSGYEDFIENIEGGILSRLKLNYDVALNGEIGNVKIVPIVKGAICSNSGESFTKIRDC